MPPASSIDRFHALLLRLRDVTFVRFAFVAVINTALGVSFFPAFYWLAGDKLNVNIILTASYVVCTLSAFTLHKFVTFNSRGNAHSEGFKFILVNVATWAVNTVLLNTILYFFDISPVIIQVIFAIVLPAGNYFIFKRYVFKK